MTKGAGHGPAPTSLRFLVVVWTMRGQDVRPITAFEAGKRLRDAYVAARGL
jgi:hypothetical protein